MSMPERRITAIVPGDIVTVHFNDPGLEMMWDMEVIHTPSVQGESWVLRKIRGDTDILYYVQQFAYIQLAGKR